MGCMDVSVVRTLKRSAPLAAMNRLRERRQRERVNLNAMYTSAVVRVLNEQAPPHEGHVLNMSESGLAVELIEPVKTGMAVTVEFSVAGLGQLVRDHWPTIIAAAEVVRCEATEDIPQGPYVVGLRFMKISTIHQAQIARYLMTTPDKKRM